MRNERRDPLPVTFDFRASDDPAVLRDWELMWDGIFAGVRRRLAARDAETTAEPPSEPSDRKQ